MGGTNLGLPSLGGPHIDGSSLGGPQQGWGFADLAKRAISFVPEAAPAPAEDAEQRMDKTQRLLRAYEAENTERKRAQAEARTAREQAVKNCEQARNRLRFVTEARSLYRLDEDGNRVVFSFEEREQREQQARAEVARWCQ